MCSVADSWWAAFIALAAGAIIGAALATMLQWPHPTDTPGSNQDGSL